MKSLVIAEKPSVARDIARVLGANQKNGGILEGKNYVVTWALGHLVTLADPEQFLDTVRPEYAVISCSSTNTYGHPSPEITKRLEETGCQTSFTMESGAVKVCWEKEGIRIKKFLEKGNSM